MKNFTHQHYQPYLLEQAMHPNQPKIVITGIGIISGLGTSFAAFSQNLLAGGCSIGALTTINTSTLTAKNGSEVKNFVAADYIDAKAAGAMDRSSQFACAAAAEAIKQCGINFSTPVIGQRTACIIGTGVGSQNTQEEGYTRLFKENATRLHPLTVPKMMTSASASQVSMMFKLQGPAFVVSSACASANHALGTALQLLRAGVCDYAVAGGTEACLTPGTIKAWEALRVMAPDVCKPFSKNRAGMSLAEGSAMFVLEHEVTARARGAVILADLAGFGQTADAGDLTSPNAESAARAVQLALADAGLAPEDIEYINAHGTGTTVNDVTETRVLKMVFGAHAAKLAISATKSQTGHALGAAGAIELAATIAALHAQTAPPTLNLHEPDPDCDLDYVPLVARAMRITAALSNSFAFGGLNAVLAVRRA